MARALVLTCEHASYQIPEEFRRLFNGQGRRLRSHQGWDPGALEVASRLQRGFSAPLVAGAYSRLLVDLNRSPSHPRVFSETTRALPVSERSRLLETIHQPHWAAVDDAIQRARVGGSMKRRGPGAQVVHLAVHSFTPELDGVARSCEIGVLYDPSRQPERELGLELQRVLKAPGRRVRRNYPYRGVADGLPTALRRRLSVRDYAGLELELNQGWLRTVGAPAVASLLVRALGELGF